MLQFKTSNNQPVSQSFNLKNAGNIDMKLLLGVIEFQDHFTMDPSQLTIQPGRETTVTASFLPTCDLNVDAIETYVQLQLISDYFTSFLPTCDLNFDAIKTYVQLKLISNYFAYMAYYLLTYSQYDYTVELRWLELEGTVKI